MGNRCCCCFPWETKEEKFHDTLREKMMQYDAYVDEDDLISLTDDNDMYRTCNSDLSASYNPCSMVL